MAENGDPLLKKMQDNVMTKHFRKESILLPEDILAWKSLLSTDSLEEIHSSFEQYKCHCHHHYTNPKRIENAVNALFKIDYKGTTFYPPFQHAIETASIHSAFPFYFFRIRKLRQEYSFKVEREDKWNRITQLEEIQKLEDVWEKLTKLVDEYQRLNKPEHSVLYTSLEPSTAILETHLKSQDFFLLIVYKNRKKFKYSDCCQFVYYNELSEEENIKRYAMFLILREEFTRMLPGSYEKGNQYCVFYEISKNFFIHHKTQSIQYPSIQNLGANNFAFGEICEII